MLAAFATSVLFADPTVTTVGNGGNNGGYGPYQTGVGGEFTLYSTALAGIISGYTPLAQDQWNVTGTTPNFQTFCVEGNEYIYPNTTSYVSFSGVSFDGDTLTKGAAYLYAQFASGGNFGGNATYNYGVGRSTTAAELQDAIWALMAGQEGQTAANNSSNPFLIAAEDEFGGTWAGADAAGGAGYDGVYILELWADNGPVDVQSASTAQQDQLIWEGSPPPSPSVPDGGTTMTLLGIGLFGLVIYRRRFSSPASAQGDLVFHPVAVARATGRAPRRSGAEAQYPHHSYR